MEDKPLNRMASTQKRGRPSNEEMAEREPPVAVRSVLGETEAIRLPPVQPMICICCGKGMTPKVIRTTADQRTIACGLCAGKMLISYRLGKPAMATRI